MSIDLHSLATQYAPLVKLFPYTANNFPNYAPCSVDWYLDRVWLHLSDGRSIAGIAAITRFWQSDLPHNVPATKQEPPYLAIPEPSADSPTRNGDVTQAVAYVHIMQTPGSSGSNLTYDLQYWFFYAVRGMSSLRVQSGPVDLYGDFSVPVSLESAPTYQGLGEHQGDWKTLTVRISGSTGRIVGVFFGQHSSGIWCMPGEFETTPNGRPVVYSARNTHSCFPSAGKFDQIDFNHDWKVLHVSLLEWTADGGVTNQWDCSQNLVIAADDTDKGFVKPVWVWFNGNWGPTYSQNATKGGYNALSNLVFPSNTPSWIKFLLQDTSFISWLLVIIGQIFGRSENGAATPPLQGMWSEGPGALPQPTLPGQASPYGAALAASSRFLYVGWTGKDSDHSLNVWPTATGGFTGKKTTLPQKSNNNLSLTVFTPPAQTSPLLYAAWTGVDDPLINIMSMTDGSLQTGNKINWSDYKGAYSPALATFVPLNTGNESIYLAFTQQKVGGLVVLWSNSGDFKDIQYQNIGGFTKTGPAMVSFNNMLRLVWTDANNGNALNIYSSASGTFSSADRSLVRVPQSSSSVTPAAAVYKDSVYLAWMESGSLHIWSSNDGSFKFGHYGSHYTYPCQQPPRSRPRRSCLGRL